MGRRSLGLNRRSSLLWAGIGLTACSILGGALVLLNGGRDPSGAVKSSPAASGPANSAIGAQSQSHGRHTWTLEALPADLISPLTDYFSGGQKQTYYMEQAEALLSECLADAGFPGYPVMPVIPLLPRTRSELVKLRTERGFGLVDYMERSAAYQSDLRAFWAGLGDRTAAFKAAYGHDYEDGPPDGCIDSSRKRASAMRTQPALPKGKNQAEVNAALDSYSADPKYIASQAAYAECVSRATGLDMTPATMITGLVMQRLESMQAQGSSEEDQRAEEQRLGALEFSCFDRLAAPELKASGLRALARAGFITGAEAQIH